MELALRIVAALEHVHQSGLVHKDLSPRSIFVEPRSGAVRLSEFGLASWSPRAPELAQQPELIEGTLRYMSPEQMGRTNRIVDSRSDLYSLGVVFFQMLTAELPFQAEDTLGWIHAHVAREPLSPRAIAREVPELLSALVLRLLAKMPEDRYQSAHGLRRDLERLRDGLPSGDTAFTLGEDDVSEQLKVSQRLYGRERELESLRGLLRETREGGRPTLVLVSGYSGVGKSSLVHELLGNIEDASGTFLSGKFDVQQRDIPYSTIILAFRRVLRDLLGGSDEQIARWRARLGKLLGQNGRLIAEVIPETELVLGPQPPVVPLPPLESEQRFLLVLHAFITAFVAAERPLVLFLDDLQWADLASLKFLQHVLTDPETHHLLVIGGFRDNEVGAASPLARSIDDIRQAGVRVEEIALGPLGLDHILALTAHTVRRPAAEVQELARLVQEKTRGNPFFINQFFNELVRDGLLAFDTRAWRWRWDLEGIRQRDYTDNVAEFVVGRIERLPGQARDLVRFAACMGNVVDSKALSTIARVDESALEPSLAAAVEQRLLFLGSDGYRFVHDRVQQAAYSLLAENERASVHLRIGRVLLETTPRERVQDRVFEIVSQMNRAVSLLDEPEERLDVARLDILAGDKARNAAAPAAAVEYLCTAIDLLGEPGWETAYELMNTAHFVRAECEFLLGHMDEAFRVLDAIEQHGKSVLARAPGRNLRAWILTNQGKLVEASKYCVETLRLLGWELPDLEDLEAIRRATGEAFEAYRAALASRSVASLAELPPLTGATELALLDTVHRAIPGAYQWNPDLMALLVLKAVLLSVPAHSAPAFFYAQYGIVHAIRTGDYDTAYELGELALRLTERPEDQAHAGATYFIHALFLSPLKRHLSVSIEYLRTALQLSLKNGDVVQANYCLGLGPSYRMYAGEALGAIRRDIPEAKRAVQAAGDVINDGLLTITHQVISALVGGTSSVARLDDAEFREAEFEASCPPGLRGIYGSMKAMLRLIGGDSQGALLAADEFTPQPGAFYGVSHRFYRGLALARQAGVSMGAERDRFLERFREDVRFMEALAQNCAINHGHRDKLFRAELAMLEGDTLTATRLYDAAVNDARDHAFIQDQALASELASYALHEQGMSNTAALYLEQARRAYRSWGAEGKVRQLERRSAARRRAPPEETLASSPEAIDVSAIIKASQAISSELDWKRVSERLLEVAVEQSGATRGCLMLERNGALLVAAVAHAEARGVVTSLLDLLPLEQSSVAPQSIVNLVARSRERIVIDEPASDAGYASDPYIRENAPRCLLCLPILRQSRISALLYLENQLAVGVFTNSRVAALELIAGQAAMALSNAELFQNLERENLERRRAEAFLSESRGLLQQIIDNTSAHVFVKSTDGRFLLTNRRFEELMRLAQEAASGTPHWEASKREWAEALRVNDVLALEANRPLEFEEQIKLPDGVHTFLSIKFPLRDETGRAYAVCGIATDISGRKRSEDELRHSMAREREARAAAEDAVRLRDEFLSVASHELRTPLTSLELAIYGIRRRVGEGAVPEIQTHLNVAARQIRRLASLVESLLDVSRIQAGRLDIERRVVNLGKLVRDTVAQLHEDLRRSGSSLKLRVADPVLGYWDAPRIEQILVNLLSNAIKFGEGKPIEVSVEAKAGKATLTVTDQGMGIPEDIQPRLFERFARGVSARHYGGLGLGLYIVRTMVEAHGGRVNVTSAPGQGARFRVEFPQLLPKGATEEVMRP